MLQEFTFQKSDGSWEDGAFSLLDAKNYGAKNGDLVMIQRYHGKTIREYERNGINDSDFYAVIWDEEKQEPRHVMWATTRAWTYSCGCIVDATPDVLEKFQEWNKTRAKAWNDYHEQEKNFIPTVGMTVRSNTSRGKAKGKTGIISSVNPGNFGGTVIRFLTDSGETVFVQTEKAEILNEKTGQWNACAIKTKLGWFVPEELLPTPKFQKE